MFPVMSAGNPITGYNINNSLRFRRSASAYLSRTPASAGNRQKWTWSGWVKRGGLASTYAYQYIFGAYSGSSALETALNFNNDDTITFFNYASGAYTLNATTTAVFRDPSAWYHIVLAIDTTQATSSNGIKLYVNGTLQTLTIPTYTQNTSTYVNNNNVQLISNNANLNSWVDGYYAEIIMVDGSQLTPSSFGASDAITGQWLPKQYSGTYGTNGFYLKFSDIATTSGSNAGLGKDSSGNGNYWTTNNISVTTGTTYDAMIDSPTLTSATVANYAVMNPIWAGYGTPTFSNANLTTVTTTAQTAVSTMTFPNSSKTYLEATFTAGVAARIGIRLVTDVTQYGGWVALSSGSIRLTDVDQQTGLATFTTNDVIGIAVDLSANTLQFYKNNVAFGTANTITNSSDWVTQTQCNSGSGLTNTIAWNFGQRPFTYTPPTGFVALNTYNLPTPTIKAGNKYMDATLYTGAGNTSTSITNASGFKPDLVWTKVRSTTYNHYLYDSVRGTGTGTNLMSNLTDAEGSNSGNANLSSFNSNGWTIGTTSGTNAMNASGQTFVGWQWQAGQGSSSSNTSGTITSTVSVNASTGFSVVTYTGGTTGTVGHGLGVTPSMIIVKNRTGAADNWYTWHSVFTATEGIALNQTSAKSTAIQWWNSTLPSSSVFSVKAGGYGTDDSGSTYVAYCWAQIAGFSKFGSYTGNGSTDGVFVYLGFRPKWIMVKRTTGTVYAWCVWDSARETYNVENAVLTVNTANAENTGTLYADFLSNGFKLRSYSNGSENASGEPYIYAAFAENPFKYSNAR